MDSEQRYFFVGLFVATILILAFFVISWFSVPKYNDKYITYAIYFDSAVTGLSIGSPVRLKGINVGKVQSIQFASFTDDQVKVLVSIIDTAPILESTRASLKTQGLTGIAYVQLENQTKNSPALVKKQDQEYMVIQSISSPIDQITMDLPVLLNQISEISSKLNDVLSQDTINSMKKTIKHIEDFTAAMPKNAPQNNP